MEGINKNQICWSDLVFFLPFVNGVSLIPFLSLMYLPSSSYVRDVMVPFEYSDFTMDRL